MDRAGQGSLYHFFYYYYYHYYCVETGMALVYPSLLSERPRGTLSCYTLTTPIHYLLSQRTSFSAFSK